MTSVPAQVVDRDEIRSAESVEVDPLDAGRVHRDVGLGAEEAEPVPVRRQLDLLGDVGAVETHRVGARLSFDRVAAVARIPDECVVACTHERPVGSSVAVDRVVPVAAEQQVGALAAGDRVVARSAVECQRDCLGGEHRRRQRVVPAEPSDGELVTRVVMLNGDHRPKAGNGDARCVAADRDRVVRIRAVHLDAVVLTVAGRPTRGAGEIEVQVRELRALQIVDGDDVGPAESVEIDPLEAREIHRHVSDVTGKPDMRPVRGNRDVLGDSRAVEAQGVGAGLAVDDVAPVAGIPDERVVARTEKGVITTAVPVHQVVPGAAEQRLRSGSADERVVSGSAVEQRLDPVGEHAVPFVDAHEIVARSRVDADPCDLLPLEAEVGLAVVTDVDLEDPGIAGLQAERDLVTRPRALDDQRAALELGSLDLVGRRLCVRGHDCARQQESGNSEQPAEAQTIDLLLLRVHDFLSFESTFVALGTPAGGELFPRARE